LWDDRLIYGTIDKYESGGTDSNVWGYYDERTKTE